MADKTAIGAGSQLQLGDGAAGTEAFTRIAKIIRIDPITETSPTVDSTTLDSAAREYVGGLADGDEFNVEAQLLMDEATHGETSGVAKAFADKTPRNFRLIPNGQSKQLQFAAIVTQRGYGPFEVDSLMRFTFRMKISGAVTIAPVVAP